MKIVATNGGKHKAVDNILIEEDFEGDIQFTDYFRRSEERFRYFEERLAKIEERLPEGLDKIEDSNNEEDDWSDDEESDTDDSDPWTIMFLQLREYKILHGDCKVPQNSKDYPKLGKWVKNQRLAYKIVKSGKKGRSITADKIIKLDSIGFDWGRGFPPPKSWDEMFAQLQNYHEKMGNCNVPFNQTNPSPLAKWTAYQRAQYKRFKQGRHSLLTLDQIGQLNEIRFNWKGPNS